MKHIFLTIIAFALFCNISYSQEYVRLMESNTSNFHDVQKAFNEYWDGKPYEKGKGWKQFKRWEYFMEPRINEDGVIANPSLPWLEHKRFQKKYGPKKGSSTNKTATSNWTPLGPTSWNAIGWNPGIGRVNVVAVDPNNSDIIYVGTPAGGCWKSSNNGASWIPLTDHFSSLGVSGIAIDPNNSNVIYLATGDGDGNDTYSIGVMKSTDGGTTWNSTGLNWSTSQARVMRKIVAHPTNSNVLWVATSAGVWKTSNAGATWTLSIGGSYRDIELNPLNPNTIFACTNTSFVKSTNGGDSFSSSSSGLPTNSAGRFAIGVTANDTAYVYIMASNTIDNGFLGIYRSTNTGSSFTLRTNSPNVMGWQTDGSDTGGQGWYDMALAVSPTNKEEIYTGGVNVWKSTDGGSTMTALTQWNWPTFNFGYVHADIHTIDFIGNVLFCGSDGGIFRSTDDGASWSDITAGIQNSQFYRLGTSATDAGIIMAGAQDNGCTLLKNGTWTHITGGDGMECIVDYSDPNIMYSTSQNGSIYKSTDGGNSFNFTSGGINDNGAWVTPYTLDPNNPNTIYAGYTDVWKSTNGGSSWNAISSFGSSTLRSLTVAPSNSNIIYAATLSNIRKTTDGGTNWTNITSGLPSNSITYITVHNLNPDILWVSFSGSNAGEKVYKSIDGGLNWTNVSGNLPNLPINCVLYENGTNNGIYVGTDIGVYYKNDDLLNWESFMEDLPNVTVNELEIHYPTGKIRAATYGRGIWESDVFETTTPPVAQFSVSKNNICPGNCVTFTNQTINLGQQWTWYFPGGVPSTSTDLNPVICYPSTGSFTVSLSATNSNGTDSSAVQNQVIVQTILNGISLPLIEPFETATTLPQDWSIINDDNGITWEHTNTVGGFGNSSSSFFIDNRSADFRGSNDYLVTPNYDFSGITSPYLTFDVAHAIFSPNRIDTLAIYYSIDCGVTRTLLWEKDGNALTTAGLFPPFFIPDPNEWRNESIDLSSLIGISSVSFLFENRSNNGHIVYLDNINIVDSATVGIETIGKDQYKIYPNPFNNNITIEGNLLEKTAITIFNSVGKLVHTEEITNLNGKATIELSQFKSGIYLIKMDNGKSVLTKTLIKN